MTDAVKMRMGHSFPIEKFRKFLSRKFWVSPDFQWWPFSELMRLNGARSDTLRAGAGLIRKNLRRRWR